MAEGLTLGSMALPQAAPTATERSDSCRAGVHAHEMYRHVAVVLEGRGDGERRSERAAEAVDQDIHGLALVACEHVVNIVSIEVITSDEPLKMELVLCARHRCKVVNFGLVNVYRNAKILR